MELPLPCSCHAPGSVSAAASYGPRYANKLECGDVEASLPGCDHVLEGTFKVCHKARVCLLEALLLGC